MIQRLLAKSRLLILIAVAGSFIAATTLLVYGGFEVVELVRHLVSSSDPDRSRALVVECIETIDKFLLGTVLYIIALGLYELFIDDSLPLPAWLEIHDLDDLKNKLASVVVIVLAVIFLEKAATWDGVRDLLGFGAAIALVIAALTYFLSQQPNKNGEGKS